MNGTKQLGEMGNQMINAVKLSLKKKMGQIFTQSTIKIYTNQLQNTAITSYPYQEIPHLYEQTNFW